MATPTKEALTQAMPKILKGLFTTPERQEVLSLLSQKPNLNEYHRTQVVTHAKQVAEIHWLLAKTRITNVVATLAPFVLGLVTFAVVYHFTH